MAGGAVLTLLLLLAVIILLVLYLVSPKGLARGKKYMTRLLKNIKPLTSNMKRKERNCLTGLKRSEFMGAVTKEMEKHKTNIRCGHTQIHRDQARVERFNCPLAERVFGHQYAVEMRLPKGRRSTTWVALPLCLL